MQIELVAREVQREINGLRPKVNKRPLVSEEAKQDHTRTPKRQKRQNVHYEIEQYEAYDPISHHILLNFKGEYATLEEKYEWQPVISLLLDYYAKGALDLVKELENAVLCHQKQYTSDNQGYIASKTSLWSLERKPIIDFGYSLDAQTPFIGYLPAYMEGQRMVIYAIRKKDGRNLFSLTDCQSLSSALQKRHRLDLLGKLNHFIQAKEDEAKRAEKSSDNQDELFQSLYDIMGGHIRLSEVRQSSAVRSEALLRYVEGNMLRRIEHVSEADYKKMGPRKARFEIQNKVF